MQLLSYPSVEKYVSNVKRIIIEPRHGVVCATSKASDQPVHTRTLIRAFACRLNVLEVLSY